MAMEPNKTNKAHNFKVTHVEMELRAKVSEHIAKQSITVEEMCEVLNKIAKSWEPNILDEIRINGYGNEDR